MIATGYEWAVARRYLLSRNRDVFISVTTFLSVLAIALGVTALIVVMSVMNGFRADLMDKILSYHGHILVGGYGGKIHDYEKLLSDLKGTDGVVKIMPFTENQVMAMNGPEARGALVRGIPDEFFNKEKLNVTKVLAGNLENAIKERGLVLGSQLAKNLGVGVGDTITIVSPQSISTPFGSTLRYLAYPVSAVVDLGIYQFNEVFIGMPLEESQRFFRLGDTVSNIEIFLNQPDAVDDVGPKVANIVGRRAYVRSWRSFNTALVSALQTERVVMFLVVGLVILVAVFNISSNLFMMVKDKAPDIAILRTVGASEASIRRIFITVGLVVGLMGIVVGCGLSALIIHNLQAIKEGIEHLFHFNAWDPSVRFVTTMTAKVDWFEVGLTIGIAVVLSFLAAVLPAWRAAKLDPVEILRYE
ncbi:lipoprotein-releasing ABC transporter permease subunit [Kordiimonas marina]|uniref:lipoprotein-releasing ABC transporter permease subunit n=1 Tax=Kordiimonas marina TaxID=2872312 RepID=UPI001FF54B2B|nr:lipoprotein-releasing ABC transporter permease subunit [Kordiimonas marina]